MDKRYYAVFLLPSLLLLLYLTTHIWQYFWWSPSLSEKWENQMLVAQLKVLPLLKQQEMGISSLYKATFNSKGLEEVRAGINSQLQLNQEMQQALLLAKEKSGSSRICQKVRVEKKRGRREVDWQPKYDRFLLAICVSGQFSNRLVCLQKHVFFAALLNRTLVLPSKKYELWAYDLENTLDIAHVQACLGNATVITFHQFEAARNKSLHVDRFICYFRNCYLDEDKQRKLKLAGIWWSQWDDAWPTDAALGRDGVPSHPHLDEFLSKFSVEDEVIATGDLFYADVEEDWVKQAGGPLSHPFCDSVIQPSRAIVLTAQRFIQTYLGNNFLSFHFRRHGWLVFCNSNPEDCFFPIPQAADCIRRVVLATNASLIFISSDAAQSELDLLKEMLMGNGRPIPIVTIPQHDPRVKWDSLLVKQQLVRNPDVIGMLEKTIHALSPTFIGTAGSTYTEDIVRLRQEWGTTTSCDGYLCGGEKPNYKAMLN